MPERGVFAGLCNCAGLIGAERKTISLSRSSALRWKRGMERGWKEREPERNSSWMKKNSQKKKTSGWRAYTVQGVRRGAVIKRLQKTARGAREGAIKARRERRVNYWTPHLAAACEAICTPGAPRSHLNSARLHCFSNPSEPNDFLHPADRLRERDCGWAIAAGWSRGSRACSSIDGPLTTPTQWWFTVLRLDYSQIITIITMINASFK